ncbi:hypothetical protein MWU75_09595 [Ornithinimicrobium sp. F0845]|uniref:hypothetical protein n=1 Tax=Ornithinimicrobium sp. F0845 TaxID=2926412 RepID=UPI001FF23D59|nr:hypothetical protein [Ornithinimicrobium sp. F0845]MCK0112389.1 hypothetical protein [Ornithinimicrobium sp. F0845]
MHTTQHTGAAHRRSRSRRTAVATLPIAALVLMTACGTEEEPEVEAPTTSAETPTEAAPTTAEPEPTTEAPTTEEPTTEPTAEATEEPTTEPAEPTSEEPPAEGAGDAMTTAEQYVELVTSGDMDAAYGMLSPEAIAYFPDVETFEENGVAELAADLADASGEPQWAVRSAYEETHDGARVVSIWGEGGDGDPFAHAFAVRQLDGLSWVVDQGITPATGETRLNWLNPGIQEGVDPWVVNPDAPITFALLKDSGPNVAVTASIDDGDEVSQQLTERPTGGAVMYDLSDSELGDGLHVVTASWVAEDEPFVHTSATPAMNP